MIFDITKYYCFDFNFLEEKEEKWSQRKDMFLNMFVSLNVVEFIPVTIFSLVFGSKDATI